MIEQPFYTFYITDPSQHIPGYKPPEPEWLKCFKTLLRDRFDKVTYTEAREMISEIRSWNMREFDELCAELESDLETEDENWKEIMNTK